MKKKIFSIMLIFVFALLFVGCGGDYAKDYTLVKDIEITDQESAVEIDKEQEAILEKFKDVKAITATANLVIDDEQVDGGIKVRTYLDLSMTLIIDGSDENNPKVSAIAVGEGSITEDDVVTKKMEIKAEEYMKDGFAYIHEYSKEVTIDADGKEHAEETDEKYKEPADIETAEKPTPGAEDVPADMNELVESINEMIEEMRKTPGAEIGKDKKGNFVLQEVRTDKDGNRKCLNRIVFKDGLLVFAGVNIGAALKLGDFIIEASINCNKGKVKFPNDLDTYKEKDSIA